MRNPVARAVILLLAGVNAAAPLIGSLMIGEFGLWILGWGIPLVLAVLAGVFMLRWAAFVYAGWSLFSAFAAFALFLSVADSFTTEDTFQWVEGLIPWSILLSLIGVVVGLIVGLVLGRKPTG